MTLRKITSLTLLISFILLILTSVILYIVPHGRVAYWSDWRLWGLSKTQWGNLHINLGVLFLLAGGLHLYYNWNPMLSYMKNRARQLRLFTPAMVTGLLICALVSIGTLMEIPPMSTVIAIGEGFKDRAAEKYGEPPYGHAELSPLSSLTQKTGLDLEQAKQMLIQAHIQGVTDSINLADLARLNHTSPKVLFELMSQAKIQSRNPAPFPDTPPPGFGRKTLEEICRTYHLDTQAIVQGLKQKGITAQATQTFKEIAKANNTDPHALFPVLYSIVVP